MSLGIEVQKALLQAVTIVKKNGRKLGEMKLKRRRYRKKRGFSISLSVGVFHEFLFLCVVM